MGPLALVTLNKGPRGLEVSSPAAGMACSSPAGGAVAPLAPASPPSVPTSPQYPRRPLEGSERLSSLGRGCGAGKQLPPTLGMRMGTRRQGGSRGGPAEPGWGRGGSRGAPTAPLLQTPPGAPSSRPFTPQWRKPHKCGLSHRRCGPSRGQLSAPDPTLSRDELGPVGGALPTG